MNSLTPLSPILATIVQAIKDDPRLKSPLTITQYRSHLVRFEEWRDGRPLSKSLVEAYAAELQRAGYKPATINQRLTVVRWWARKVIDQAEDHLEDTPQARRELKRAARVLTVGNVRGERPPRGRYLTQEEQRELLSACQSDPTPAGVRDTAMIAAALSVGLRRDDLTTLTMDAIKNMAEDGCDLVIHGKGDRVDTLYLYNGGYKALRAWLYVRGQAPGQVFTPVLKNDKVDTDGKLSGEALRLILDTRQVGLSFEHITWHDMRKSFICGLLDKGVDLSTVQKLGRHRSPNTTANIYDIRGEKVKRAAVQTIEIPL
jgi:site-specific recombinase XerD